METNNNKSKSDDDHGDPMVTVHKREGEYEEDLTLYFPKSLFSSKRMSTEEKESEMGEKKQKTSGRASIGGRDTFVASAEGTGNEKSPKVDKVDSQDIVGSSRNVALKKSPPVATYRSVNDYRYRKKEPGEKKEDEKPICELSIAVEVSPDRTCRPVYERDFNRSRHGPDDWVDGKRMVYCGGAAVVSTGRYSVYMVVQSSNGRNVRYGTTRDMDMLAARILSINGPEAETPGAPDFKLHCHVTGFVHKAEALLFRKLWQLHNDIIRDLYDLSADDCVRVAVTEIEYHYEAYPEALMVFLHAGFERERERSLSRFVEETGRTANAADTGKLLRRDRHVTDD